MAAPTKPYVISSKVSGTNIDKLRVRAYNRSNQESFTVETNSKGEFQFDLSRTAHFPTTYSNAQVVDIQISGAEYGSTTHTINTSEGSTKLSTISL